MSASTEGDHTVVPANRELIGHQLLDNLTSTTSPLLHRRRPIHQCSLAGAERGAEKVVQEPPRHRCKLVGGRPKLQLRLDSHPILWTSQVILSSHTEGCTDNSAIFVFLSKSQLKCVGCSRCEQRFYASNFTSMGTHIGQAHPHNHRMTTSCARQCRHAQISTHSQSYMTIPRPDACSLEKANPSCCLCDAGSHVCPQPQSSRQTWMHFMVAVIMRSSP